MANLTTGWFRERATLATTDEAAPSYFSATAPTNMVLIDGYSTVALRFIGTNAANEACTVNAWLIDVDNHVNPSCYFARHFCSIAAVLGTGTGADGTIVTASEFFGDAAVITAKGSDVYDTIRQTGDTATYTGGDNTMSETFIYDTLGAYGLVLAYTAATGTCASFGALIKLIAER
jgi:hypothetical protein